MLEPVPQPASAVSTQRTIPIPATLIDDPTFREIPLVGPYLESQHIPHPPPSGVVAALEAFIKSRPLLQPSTPAILEDARRTLTALTVPDRAYLTSDVSASEARLTAILDRLSTNVDRLSTKMDTQFEGLSARIDQLGKQGEQMSTSLQKMSSQFANTAARERNGEALQAGDPIEPVPHPETGATMPPGVTSNPATKADVWAMPSELLETWLQFYGLYCRGDGEEKKRRFWDYLRNVRQR